MNLTYHFLVNGIWSNQHYLPKYIFKNISINQILAQFKLLWIASPHLLYFASRIFVDINGLNEVIDELSSLDSKDHNPIVLAAANAAPNEVVSAISGRTTSIPELTSLFTFS